MANQDRPSVVTIPVLSFLVTFPLLADIALTIAEVAPAITSATPSFDYLFLPQPVNSEWDFWGHIIITVVSNLN